MSFFFAGSGGGGPTPFYGYTISNSLRLNDNDSANLSRTYTSSATWTFSAWIKRANISAVMWLLEDAINYNSGDTITAEALTTTAVYRDVAGWAHVCVSNNGLEINGVNLGSVTTSALTNSRIGTNGTNYFDGYLAEVHFCDGTAYSASTFAEDKNGVWIPKSPSVTYGTEGYYLDFADNSTAAALGTDQSGNGNDWTINNISTYDQMLDTPTNNYPTLNPLFTTTANGAIQEGGLEEVVSSATAKPRYMSSLPSSGKWYAEARCTGNGGGGSALITTTIGVKNQTNSNSTSLASGAFYYSFNGNKYLNGSSTAYGTSWSTGGSSYIIGIAVDFDSDTIEFYLNGVAQGSISYTFSGEYSFGACWVSSLGSGSVVWNLGQDSSFAGGVTRQNNTDSNGEGDFYYSPPSGYLALCSANMTAPSFEDGTDAITVTLDTEANIASSVATARTGWTDYVDILKNRDNAEGWAYRFSHDSGNEYDVSTTATYQANRALSGTDGWVGYSIQIGSTYGTAAGSASHTNGAATTVTHNLGTTDYAVLLFPRSNGAVKVHHPQLTSGDLLTLTSTAAETADTTITNILSNSFDIGSGATTDTYDYLVLSSSAGLFYLGSYTGNASTNGTFSFAGLRSSALMIKRIDTTANWVMLDEEREGYNVDNDALTPNTTAAEGTADLIDILSNGLKCRSTDATVNASSGSYVYIAMQKTVFKYANAR